MVGNLNAKRMGTRTGAIWVLAFVAALALLAGMASMSDGAEAQETKDISMYFHNVTNSVPIGNVATLRTMDTIQGEDSLTTTTPTINSVKTDFYLYPALANDTTIEGDITLYMWAIRTVRMGDSDQATLIWELYDVDETGAKVAKISRGLRTLSMIIDWKQYWVGNVSTAKYTVSEGHYLLLEFELQGSSSNEYQVGWGDTSYRSKIVIESHDYVRVDHADTRDHTGTPSIAFDYDAADKDITFHADVTDPFGGYDIRFANVTLQGPGGGIIMDEIGMSKVSGYFTSWRSGFELQWNYDGYPAGMYNLTIGTVDNSGWYFRYPSHPENETYGGHLETLTVAFWIGGPPQEVIVEVRDNLTLPLAGALVTVYESTDLTNSTGHTVLLVSNGTFPITVRWQGILVYEDVVTVDGPTHVNVSTAVYYPVFNVLDDLGDPLEDAVALVEHPNGTILATFGRTDDQGRFALARMPGGEYGITMLWLGATVHDDRLVIDGNGPFNLTTWVYTLDVRVEDDEGTGLDLAQVIALNSTSHLVMDSRLTDMDGNLTIRLPLGSYDVVVYWRAKLVHDSTTDLLVNASGDITLLADIFRLDMVVTDSSDLPLADAKVVVADDAGQTVLDFGITDADGAASTRLASGIYTVTVYWRDVLVSLDPEVVVDGHGTVNIVAAVHWVTFTVDDAMGDALSSAGLALVHASGQSFGTRLTDGNGTATFRLPAGTYTATVTWLGVVVLEDDIDVVSADPQTLDVAVYHVTLLVVDTLDQPLEGATVSVHVMASGQSAGTGVTDVVGGTTMRLPAGEASARVTWLDSPVHDGTITVEDNGEVTLVASVHVVTFKAVDSREVVLESALIDLVNADTERSFGSAVTHGDGEATFRLPAGDYLTDVIWMEQPVFNGVTPVASNDPVTLECAVFYLEISLVDSDGEPLEGAHVTVTVGPAGPTLGSLATDADGKAVFRLPEGTFTITADWLGVGVLNAEIVASSDGVHVLGASVHYVDVTLSDSRDAPVADARLVVYHPTTAEAVAVGTTGQEGDVTLRLPLAIYDLEVHWMDELCLASTLDVEGDGPIRLTVWVHYLTFHVMDGDGMDLDGADVGISSLATGVMLGSGGTGTDGNTELRLPVGTFSLEVTWMGVTVHSDLGLVVEGDSTFTVNATVHYLTVKVRGADGAGVGKAAIVAFMDGRTLSTGDTASDGSLVLRLPAGTYTVDMTLRTTYRLSNIDVSMSKDVVLDGSQTLRFDLDDTQYPVPIYNTNLFWVVLAIILLVIIILFLARGSIMRAGRDGPAGEGAEDGSEDLEVLLDDDQKVSLTDQMEEAEIELDED